MMVGQFDIGFGSISGNTLNPLDFMSVLSSDMSISKNFTLNWAVDTNDASSFPLVYRGEKYSYDAFYFAANNSVFASEGVKSEPTSYTYNKIVKNTDGSYTGSMEITATLPDSTTIAVDQILCCNYERYYNGDGEYVEKEITFTTEDKGNGVILVTFTVPADVAADFATGSGTSAEPTGFTGFDVYFTYTIDGASGSDMHGVQDNFVIE